GREGSEDAGGNRRRQGGVPRARRVGARCRQVARHHVVRDPDRSGRDDCSRRGVSDDRKPTFDGYEKILVCFAISIAVHYALKSAREQLPAPVLAAPPHKVEVRVVRAPPRDPEPEPPKPPKPEPKQVVHERPAPARVAVHDVAPKEAPPPDHPAV